MLDFKLTIDLTNLNSKYDLSGSWTLNLTARAQQKLKNLIAANALEKTEYANLETHCYIWSAPDDELDYEFIEDLENRIRCNKHFYAHRMWIRESIEIDLENEVTFEVGGIKFCIPEDLLWESSETAPPDTSLTVDYLDGGFGPELSWFIFKHGY